MFEPVCKMIKDNIANSTVGQNAFHCLLAKCWTSLSSIQISCVSLVRRQANFVTHKLANTLIFHDNSHNFICILTFVQVILLNEMI